MAQVSNLLLLPDPAMLSEALQTLASECSKIFNIPAFNEGATIIQALVGLRQDMQDMQAMRADMQAMRADMQAMRADMQAMQADMNKRFDGLELRIHIT